MKLGDLVRTKGRHQVLWREPSSLQGHKDFVVPPADIMLVVDGPWVAKWSKPETGERSATYVRVLHPAYGVVRGDVSCLELINVDEAR